MSRHIKRSDRLEISILLKKGHSLRSIAQAIQKDHSSLSREIKNNSTKGVYDPLKADAKANYKRQKSKYQGMKVRKDPELENYVIESIKNYQTPDEIAGRLRKTYQRTIVSANAIYKYLYSPYGQSLCIYLPSRQYHRKHRAKAKGKRELIKNRVFIDLRPAIINQRARFGDWEADTLGKPNSSKSVISGIEERLSRKLLLSKDQGLSYAMDGFKKMLNPHREISQSITFDNGIENVHYQELKLTSYFCHAHSAWEKGSIENSFQRLRRFIPKKASPDKYTQEQLNVIMDIMNNTPRKCLGYSTPEEIFNEQKELFKYRGGASQG